MKDITINHKEHLDSLIKQDFANSKDIKQLITSIREYYGGIIDHLPGNIYWLDTKCKGVGCNLNVLKTLQLKSIQEFIGMDFPTMAIKAGWTKGQGEKFLLDTQEVIKSGLAKYNIEEPPIPDNTGNLVYFLTSRVPLFNQAREVIGVVGISTDITSQKKVEQALLVAKAEIENANQSIKFFVANMSHDLRTLASCIVSVSELLPLFKNDEEQTLQFHSMLKISAQKLLNMVNEILDLSWQGKVKINLKKENVTDIFYDTAKIFSPLFQEKDLLFTSEISDKFPTIMLCDSNALVRIVSNLLSNALKYTHQGEIKLTVQPVNKVDKTWIEIKVSDTGIGIPQEKFDVIFELFSRLHHVDASIYEGLGIGLSIVKALTHSLGGYVEVESELEKGSTFTCWLPFPQEVKK